MNTQEAIETCEAKREATCPQCNGGDNKPYVTERGIAMRACFRCMIQWRDEHAADSARPAKNDVALAIAYWETTLKHDGERFEKGEDHLLRTLIDAAASRWHRTADQRPTEAGDYILKIAGGGFIVRHMRDEIDFSRRDFTHYQKIEYTEDEK